MPVATRPTLSTAGAFGGTPLRGFRVEHPARAHRFAGANGGLRSRERLAMDGQAGGRKGAPASPGKACTALGKRKRDPKGEPGMA